MFGFFKPIQKTRSIQNLMSFVKRIEATEMGFLDWRESGDVNREKRLKLQVAVNEAFGIISNTPLAEQRAQVLDLYKHVKSLDEKYPDEPTSHFVLVFQNISRSLDMEYGEVMHDLERIIPGEDGNTIWHNWAPVGSEHRRPTDSPYLTE